MDAPLAKIMLGKELDDEFVFNWNGEKDWHVIIDIHY
jgi:transcription elongation GreA/GreB family factor